MTINETKRYPIPTNSSVSITTKKFINDIPSKREIVLQTQSESRYFSYPINHHDDEFSAETFQDVICDRADMELISENLISHRELALFKLRPDIKTAYDTLHVSAALGFKIDKETTKLIRNSEVNGKLAITFEELNKLSARGLSYVTDGCETADEVISFVRENTEDVSIGQIQVKTPEINIGQAQKTYSLQNEFEFKENYWRRA